MTQKDGCAQKYDDSQIIEFSDRLIKGLAIFLCYDKIQPAPGEFPGFDPIDHMHDESQAKKDAAENQEFASSKQSVISP